MSTTTRKAAPDTRTSAQIERDEALARAAESGDWTGIKHTVLLTPEGAQQLLEFSRNLDPAEVRARATKQPFRWKEHVFRITRCDYVNGQSEVAIEPHDAELVAELRKRIEANRFHILPFYQGFGFIAFPEDHARYEER
jgi:hypothetical protein